MPPSARTVSTSAAVKRGGSVLIHPDTVFGVFVSVWLDWVAVAVSGMGWPARSTNIPASKGVRGTRDGPPAMLCDKVLRREVEVLDLVAVVVL